MSARMKERKEEHVLPESLALDHLQVLESQCLLIGLLDDECQAFLWESSRLELIVSRVGLSIFIVLIVNCAEQD